LIRLLSRKAWCCSFFRGGHSDGLGWTFANAWNNAWISVSNPLPNNPSELSPSANCCSVPRRLCWILEVTIQIVLYALTCYHFRYFLNIPLRCWCCAM
jgi:hypothetical protein